MVLRVLHLQATPLKGVLAVSGVDGAAEAVVVMVILGGMVMATIVT